MTMAVDKMGPFSNGRRPDGQEETPVPLKRLWRLQRCQKCTNKPAIGLCYTTISQWTLEPRPVNKTRKTNAKQALKICELARLLI